jgi:hypothetical protein
MSLGVDASTAWPWTSRIMVSGSIGAGFTEGRATIAAGGACESEVDAGVVSITSCSSAPGAGKSMLARRLATILPAMRRATRWRPPASIASPA